MYNMNHKAPRRYSQGRDFGVDRQEDFAVDIVPRRSSVPYEKRVKKGPYSGSRNLVWTSKEFQASEGNRPRKNEAYRSTSSSVSRTGYRVSNHPRKNEVYRSMNSPPVSGTGNRVSNQPRKDDLYGSRSSSILGSRVWRSGDNGSPKSKYVSIGKLETARRVSNVSSYTLDVVFLAW